MFTRQDLKLLDDALTAWKEVDFLEKQLSAFAITMLMGGKENSQVLCDGLKKDAEEERDRRKERIIPLKATIQKMKDSTDAEEFLKSI